MPELKPTPTRSDVMALSSALDATDAAIAVQRSVLAEIEARSDALNVRRDEHSAGKPVMAAPHDDELIAALAADPACKHKAADLSGVARTHRDETAVWERHLSLIDQARGRLAGEIAAARASIAEAEEAREEEWLRFMRAANDYLVEAFRDAFVRSCEEFGDAATELQGMKDAKWQELLRGYHHRIDCRELTIRREATQLGSGDVAYDTENGRLVPVPPRLNSVHAEEKLFPRSIGLSKGQDGSTPVQRFRDALCAAAASAAQAAGETANG